jgi:hypothetical protein
MTIYDHVLAFASEAAAQQALPSFCNQDQQGVWRWDQSRVIPNIKIITAEAVYEGEGMDRELVSPEEVLPGFWVAIALTELSTTLRDLPNEACRLITDRDAANAGGTFQQFTVYASPSLDLLQVQSYRVAPVFAGSKYPFGV